MDPRTFKLGKKAARLDPRTPRFGSYVDRTRLPPCPPTGDWLKKVNTPLGVMGNDAAGDCTFAGLGHMVMIWSANARGQAVVIPDADILGAYSALTGYDPSKTDAEGNNPTDQGAVEQDVLNYALNTGVGGHKIAAYAAIDVHNLSNVRESAFLLGGTYLGVSLPLSAQEQTGPGKVWDVVHGKKHGNPTPGSWGGHCVNIFGWGKDYVDVVTWGERQRVTLAFFRAYVDEAWGLVSSSDWLSERGISPNGFDLDALRTDLAVMSH